MFAGLCGVVYRMIYIGHGLIIAVSSPVGQGGAIVDKLWIKSWIDCEKRGLVAVDKDLDKLVDRK